MWNLPNPAGDVDLVELLGPLGRQAHLRLGLDLRAVVLRCSDRHEPRIEAPVWRWGADKNMQAILSLVL